MEDMFKTDEITHNYALCRSIYPPGIPLTIMEFLRKHSPTDSKYSKMVDVACGGGQATKILSDYFEQVIGFDISENQIKTAMVDKPDNVKYMVASAKEFPCEDGSADLVLCAEAVHFLDWNAFLKETERVLKPNGCLALLGYLMPTITPFHVDGDKRQQLAEVATRIVREFKLKGGYRDWVRDAFESKYLKFYDLLPWERKERDVSMKTDLTWSMTQLMHYADSLPNYKICLEKLRKDALRQNPNVSEEVLMALDYGRKMRHDVKKAWGVQSKSDKEIFMKVEFDIYLVLGCRDQA